MTELTKYNGKTVDEIRLDTSGSIVKFTDGTAILFAASADQWSSAVFVNPVELEEGKSPSESECGIENDGLLVASGFPESV